jgi:hypothetical protein
VVLDVLSDAAAYGACRSSDLARLRQRGVVGPGDLEVVLEVPALPELIFASREDDASYLVDRLGGLGAVFEDPSASPRDRDVVELLKERGVGSVRPVTGSQLAELEAVFEFMCARERRGEPTR